MTDVFKTVIVTAATKTDDTTTPLSATGKPPATHYIASGFMPEELIETLAALPDADVSDEEPFVAMNRLGLVMMEDKK